MNSFMVGIGLIGHLVAMTRAAVLLIRHAVASSGPLLKPDGFRSFTAPSPSAFSVRIGSNYHRTDDSWPLGPRKQVFITNTGEPKRLPVADNAAATLV